MKHGPYSYVREKVSIQSTDTDDDVLFRFESRDNSGKTHVRRVVTSYEHAMAIYEALGKHLAQKQAGCAMSVPGRAPVPPINVTVTP